jgi:hypothetical protein
VLICLRYVQSKLKRTCNLFSWSAYNNLGDNSCKNQTVVFIGIFKSLLLCTLLWDQTAIPKKIVMSSLLWLFFIKKYAIYEKKCDANPRKTNQNTKSSLKRMSRTSKEDATEFADSTQNHKKSTNQIENFPNKKVCLFNSIRPGCLKNNIGNPS